MDKELEFNLLDIVNKHKSGEISQTYVIITCSNQVIRDGIRESLGRIGLRDDNINSILGNYPFERYKYIFISNSGTRFFMHNEYHKYKNYKSEDIFWLA